MSRKKHFLQLMLIVDFHMQYQFPEKIRKKLHGIACFFDNIFEFFPQVLGKTRDLQ